MKSYFDPVLEKNTTNKKTRETFVSNFKLQDESIILYDNYEFNKIDIFFTKNII